MMKIRFLLLLFVVSSAMTFLACSACSPAAPANGNSTVAVNSVTAQPTTGAPSPTNTRPVSRAVPQGPADPMVQMEGPDAGPKRINFAPGAGSATIAGKVENTGRVDHVVSGQGGKTVTVSITSTDSNATFWIQHEKGKEMKGAVPADNARTWTGKLNLSGDYYIIVKGAKGPADYQLTVTIK